MKYLIYILLIINIMTGCAKTKDILFCEGVSKEGEGVNCGTKFETGELTAIIKSKEPFGVKTISVQIFKVKEKKDEMIETLNIDVKPDNKEVNTNLSFYSGGKFRVKALNKKEYFSEGEIEIVE